MTGLKLLDADSPVGPDRYYKSFVSYEIPVQPDEEVSFAGTEGLRSYYVARHDAGDRVTDLTKILLVSEGTREVELPAPEPPGSAVYFAAARQPWGRPGGVGPRVEYTDTEGMTDVFEGRVGPSGRDCRVTLFRRERAFRDVYTYWPDGRLKGRELRRGDGPPSVWHFDADGNPTSLKTVRVTAGPTGGLPKVAYNAGGPPGRPAEQSPDLL